MNGLYFQDEFEHEIDGKLYYISVEGQQYSEEDGDYTDIESVDIADEEGTTLERGDTNFAEIQEVVHNRDYQVEEHSTNFDHYDYIN